MKRPIIVNISLAGPEGDYDSRATFLEQTFRLVREGLSGDVDLAVARIVHWRGRAAAFALSGVREARALGLLTDDTDVMSRLRAACGGVPVTDGDMLTDVLQEWAIRGLQTELPGYFTNARTLVLGSGNHTRTVRVLEEFTDNVEHADPLAMLDNVALRAAATTLGLAADVASLGMRVIPGRLRQTLLAPAEWVGHEIARRATRDCDVVVASYDELTGFGLEDLAGTTVISSAISPDRLAELGGRGVDRVLDTTPQPFRHITVVAAVLEAMMLVLDDDGHLTTDELLQAIQSAGIEPRSLMPNGPRRKTRFAFVIHPLSTQYFRNVQPLRAMTQVPGMTPVIEKAAAYLPPSSTATSPGSPHRPVPRPRGGSSPSGGPPRSSWRTAPSSPTRGCSTRPRSPASSGPRSWASAPSPRWSATPGSRSPGAPRCP